MAFPPEFSSTEKYANRYVNVINDKHSENGSGIMISINNNSYEIKVHGAMMEWE